MGEKYSRQRRRTAVGPNHYNGAGGDDDVNNELAYKRVLVVE